MPELPDIDVYVEALEQRTLGSVLERVRIASPFLLRTVTPSIKECERRTVVGYRRLGKRIVFQLRAPLAPDAARADAGDDLFLVVHLMIAGRFRWREPDAPIPKKLGLAAFDFANGTVLFTEAGTQRRASIHVTLGESGLFAHDPGGMEVLAPRASVARFAAALRDERHTLKRSLTDPRLFSGIGNAYSDEILHHARLSPVAMSDSLDDATVARLFASCRRVLADWRDRLRKESGGDFPEHVTAFREGMAVHGRFGKPCPDCATPVQRIRYASNETNYCPTCQTGGRLLADRSLSRLLRGDWPRSLDELEERRAAGRTRDLGVAASTGGRSATSGGKPSKIAGSPRLPDVKRSRQEPAESASDTPKSATSVAKPRTRPLRRSGERESNPRISRTVRSSNEPGKR